MKPTFQIAPLPRVLVGEKTVEELPKVLRRLKAERALVLTDPGLREAGIVPRVLPVLRRTAREVSVFDRVVPEPGLPLLEEAAARCREFKPDLLVGLGDGSAIDTAKILSVLPEGPVSVADLIDDPDRMTKQPVPVVAIPTTNGLGGEISTHVTLKDSRKPRMVQIQRPQLVPRVAIVDPTLTYTLPPDLTAVSGVDALFHAVESMVSTEANHYTSMLAYQAIRLIAANIRQVVERGEDVRSRYYVALGSFYAGLAQVNAGAGPIHALAYPLTARNDVSHGVAICLMAPAVTEHLYPAVPDRFRSVAEAMGENVRELSDERGARLAFERLTRLLREVRVPSKLDEHGIQGLAIEEVVQETLTYKKLLERSPREITPEDVKRFFRKAL